MGLDNLKFLLINTKTRQGNKGASIRKNRIFLINLKTTHPSLKELKMRSSWIRCASYWSINRIPCLPSICKAMGLPHTISTGLKYILYILYIATQPLIIASKTDRSISEIYFILKDLKYTMRNIVAKFFIHGRGTELGVSVIFF